MLLWLLISSLGWATPIFVGPLEGWLNAADFGAAGDGVQDDTEALQRAVDTLMLASDQAVLYLPAGRYRISRTLEVPSLDPERFPHAKGKLGFVIVGEDPATTSLIWDGPDKGVMLHLASQAHSRYGRLTFDGKGRASACIRVEMEPRLQLYSSWVQLHDLVLTGAEVGIHNTDLNRKHEMDDSYSILRCRFEGLTRAGVRIEAGNAYCWSLRFNTFVDCAIGVENIYGDFEVAQCIFRGSTQTDIVARGHRAGGFKHNWSIGSRQFLQLEDGRYSVRHNTVLAPRELPAIQVQANRPETRAVLIDNRLDTGNGQGGELVQVSGKAAEQALVRIPATADAVQAPALPATPLRRTDARVFRVASADELQATIDAAAEAAMANPDVPVVVHLPAGDYPIQKPIVVPAEVPLILHGDGGLSRLRWQGPRSSIQPALLLRGPSRVTLIDIGFHHGRKVGETFLSPIADIVVDQADQLGARIVADNCWLAGAFADRLSETRIDLYDYYGANYGGWLYTTLKSRGPVMDRIRGARLSMHGLLMIGDQVHGHVLDGGRLAMSDFWHEENSRMTHPWLLMEGGGLAMIEAAFLFQHRPDHPMVEARSVDGLFLGLATRYMGGSSRLSVVGKTDDFHYISMGGAETLGPYLGLPQPGKVVTAPQAWPPSAQSLLDMHQPQWEFTALETGVTDVRLHRVGAYYQNGWGVWVRPDAHPLTGNGVSVAALDVDALERDQRPVRFEFRRDLPGESLTVHYDWTGTASPEDFLEDLTGQITFSAGEVRRVLTLTPKQHDGAEAPEWLQLRVLPGPGYTPGIVRQSVRERVYLHDETEPPVLSLKVQDGDAAEGVADDTIQLLVCRSQPFGDQLVTYEFSGDRAAGDFIEQPSGKLVIPHGEYTSRLVLTPVDDSRHQGKQTVHLRLPGQMHEQAVVTVTIADNDRLAFSVVTAEDGFRVRRNSELGRAIVPAVLQLAGGETQELSVSFAPGEDSVAFPLPRDASLPAMLTLQPVLDSNLADLQLPEIACRYWWSVTATEVVAVDLLDSSWSTERTKPGEPRVAFRLPVPAEIQEDPGWDISATPATSVAWDPVHRVLWIMSGFKPNGQGIQTLWKVVNPWQEGDAAQLLKVAVFGSMQRGVSLPLTVLRNGDLLVRTGGAGNTRWVTHVPASKELGDDRELTRRLHLQQVAETADGMLYGRLHDGVYAWGSPGVLTEAGTRVTTEDEANIFHQGGVLVPVPALLRRILPDEPELVITGLYATFDMLHADGEVVSKGHVYPRYRGAATFGAIDPWGRLWLRPYENHSYGMVFGPSSDFAWWRQVLEIRYLSYFTFGDTHAYIQNIEGDGYVLMRQPLQLGAAPTFLRLQVTTSEGQVVNLSPANADPTGYHRFRLDGPAEPVQATLYPEKE